MDRILKVFYSKDPYFFKERREKKESLLLKIIFSDETYGFISLQTWESLGDLNLGSHLKLLKKGYLTDFIQNAFRLSAYYRSPLWENLFTQSKILNHYLITDLFDFLKWIRKFYGKDEKKALILFSNFLEKNQFKKLKIKIKKEKLTQQTEILKKIVSNFSFPFLIRLDFNRRLSFLDFKNWILKNQWIKEHLDFIEDPFFYHGKKWEFLSEKFSISFAFDRAFYDFRKIQKELNLKKDFRRCFNEYQKEKLFRDPFLNFKGFQVLVIKPTIENIDQIFKKWKKLSIKEKKSLYFVLTHNGGHWLDRLYSLLEAKRFKALLGARFKKQFLDSGLLSEDLYKENEKGKSERRWTFKGGLHQMAFLRLNQKYKKEAENYLKKLPWKLLVDFS